MHGKIVSLRRRTSREVGGSKSFLKSNVRQQNLPLGSSQESCLLQDPPSLSLLPKTTRSACLSSILDYEKTIPATDACCDGSLPSSKQQHEEHHVVVQYLCWILAATRINELLNYMIQLLQDHVHHVPILLKWAFIRELVRRDSDWNLASCDNTATMTDYEGDEDHGDDDEQEYCFISPISIVSTTNMSSSVEHDEHDESDDDDSWGHFADFQESPSQLDSLLTAVPLHDPFQSLLRQRVAVQKLSALAEEQEEDDSDADVGW